MEAIMSATDVAFAGSIPALYERYLVPLLFLPFAEDMAGRLKDLRNGRILETAAGTGVVTRAMAKALPPEVEILATDLNQAMLDLAATRLQEPNVRWQQADAQALPFEDAAFDAVVCQFGVMFFPDKQAGYREALRLLKPGGRFVFSVWDRLEANPVSQAVSEAVAELFPDDPPRFLERVPFGYADADRILGEVERAGFERVEIDEVEKVSLAASPREPTIGLCQGAPLRSEIEARAPGRLDEITEKAARAIAARFGPGPIENRMRALVITAWRT
jgi:ubiquinone/menaquinone biosynthesis C-methylase UbiE